MKKILYLLLLLSAGIIASCKKEKKTGGTDTGSDPDKPSKTGTAVQLAQDSIYLYAKENYLWYDQLPDYATFKPRSFTDAAPLNALQDEMDALSQKAINPATGKPYEYYPNAPGHAKYSFIDDGTATAAENGVKGDFGFDYNYNLVNDIRVVYVYPGSPAGLAGITRGCQITAINDDSDISYDGLFSDGTKSGTGTSAHNNFVFNSIFNSGTIKLTVKKLNGTSFTTSLATTNYNVNPVLKDTVLDAGAGHKIGYVVFNSFVADNVADPKLNAAFNRFATNGVTDLVVDLRYNGGGYVSTAEYLTNLISPSAKTGSLMYSSYYNSIITAGTEQLLKNQVYKDASGTYTLKDVLDYEVANNTVNFTKKGTVNVNRVFFLVTGNTASASELVINNLLPVMDVELVGETTYGKPVGFFPININKYIMYTPEVAQKNSAGNGGYFAGMTPGSATYKGVNDYDDFTKDFGDPTDALLAHVISKVKTGAFNTPKKVVQSTSENARSFSLEQSRDKNMFLNNKKFTGMIFEKKGTKKK